MVLSLNDDRLIMEFLSGRYTGNPQGYGIHLKYPLSGLIALFYRMAPDYDWYGYAMLGLLSLCVMMITFRTARLTRGNRYRKVIVLCVPAVSVFAFGTQFVSITYSTVAAVMGATVLFLYGTSDGRKSDVICLGILSAVTWCLRYHLFLMILPAAGLIWLYRDFFSKKKAFEKVAVPLSVLMFVGGSILINSMMYSSEEWQEFEAFNNSRITIYDNPNDYYFPPYEEKRQYYEEAGLNNVQRRLLIYYGLLLGRDEIPTDTFHEMVRIRKNYGDNESEYLSTRFITGTERFVQRIIDGECGMLFYIGAAGFAALIILTLKKKQWREFFEISFFFLCQIGIFWGMEMNGRMPERVIYSLSVMMFLCMVTAIYWERKILPGGKVARIAGILLSAALFVYGVFEMYGTFESNAAAVAINHEKERVVDYCNAHQENFYYITTGYLCTSGYNFYFGKTDNSQMNYMSTGDWVSYSPLQRERLEQEGWKSAVDSLLNGENVYLISGDDKYLAYFRDYLEYRCEQKIIAVKEDRLTDHTFVYRFEKQ